MQTTLDITADALEMIGGLEATEKYITSKFFYDDAGSRIFQKIMQMPEYYPTNCETEILENHKQSIGTLFCNNCCSVDLVELGAGDGQKTRILIRELLGRQVNFRYIPVDISKSAVEGLENSLQREFPMLTVEPLIGDYFRMLENLSETYPNPKVVMFLGSNLGNLNREQSISFLSNISRSMLDNDRFFIGLDLKKDPGVIRRAYDDPHGYTREFNLNLLVRLNRELGADFNTDHFIHAPSYDPADGAARSYLVSTEEQEVFFAALDKTILFEKGERIYTEMSQKYDLEMIADMAEKSGFEIVENFFDRRKYFINSIWKKI